MHEREKCGTHDKINIYLLHSEGIYILKHCSYISVKSCVNVHIIKLIIHLPYQTYKLFTLSNVYIIYLIKLINILPYQAYKSFTLSNL